MHRLVPFDFDLSYKVVKHQVTGGVTTSTEIETFGDITTARERARSLNRAGLDNPSQDVWHTITGPFASPAGQPSQSTPSISNPLTVSHELQLKHSEIQSDRPQLRKSYAKLFLLFLLLTPAVLIPIIAYGFPFGIGSGIFVIILPLILLDFAWKTYSPLTTKSKAFEKVYEAIGKVESSSGLSGRRYIHNMLESAISDIESENSEGDYLQKEPNELVGKLLDNLRNRLLPSASRGDLRKNTLTLLAKVVDAPTMEGIQNLNADLSTYPETRPPKGKSLREWAIGFSRNRYGANNGFTRLCLRSGVHNILHLCFSSATRLCDLLSELCGLHFRWRHCPDRRDTGVSQEVEKLLDNPSRGEPKIWQKRTDERSI